MRFDWRAYLAGLTVGALIVAEFRWLARRRA